MCWSIPIEAVAAWRVENVQLAGLDEDAKLQAQQVVARVSSRRPPERGSMVRMGVDAEHIHVFSDVTQERLS